MPISHTATTNIPRPQPLTCCPGSVQVCAKPSPISFHMPLRVTTTHCGLMLRWTSRSTLCRYDNASATCITLTADHCTADQKTDTRFYLLVINSARAVVTCNYVLLYTNTSGVNRSRCFSEQIISCKHLCIFCVYICLQRFHCFVLFVAMGEVPEINSDNFSKQKANLTVSTRNLRRTHVFQWQLSTMHLRWRGFGNELSFSWSRMDDSVRVV